MQIEPIIAYEDVTGTLVYFSAAQVDNLIRLLTPEHKRFAVVLANTIKKPHEIWQYWMDDVSGQGKRNKIRTYLQYLDLSNADINTPFGISMAQFIYRARWELQKLELETGEKNDVMEIVNGSIRKGSIEYSIAQH